MSRLKTTSPSRARTPSKTELTLLDALRRVEDPEISECISVFYAQLARAQKDGDKEAIEYIRGSIAEAMQGVPDGPIDMPLSEALRKWRRKRHR